MSISKKIRFEVFKRDGFQCAYCGKTPPNAMLEVDHINPVSEGGTDDMNNLITSCFDCNRGKSNITLDKIPQQLNENLEVLKQKEEQLKEYNKVLKKIEKRINTDIDDVDSCFNNFYNGNHFSKTFRISVKKFLSHLSKIEVMKAMETACSRNLSPEHTIKYFCAICWRTIKENSKENYGSHQYQTLYTI